MNNMKAIGQSIIGWIGNFQDLDGVVKEMFYGAAQARLNAQAPYSNYLVGVTVMSAKTGGIFRGVNVERGSWTQTTHAEQNAIDSMVTWEGSSKISKVVLVAGPRDADVRIPPVIANPREIWQIKFTEIPVPCGHCLQCIWENCHSDGKVELYSLLPTGEAAMVTMDTAFPLKFGPADLGINYER